MWSKCKTSSIKQLLQRKPTWSKPWRLPKPKSLYRPKPFRPRFLTKKLALRRLFRASWFTSRWKSQRKTRASTVRLVRCVCRDIWSQLKASRDLPQTTTGSQRIARRLWRLSEELLVRMITLEPFTTKFLSTNHWLSWKDTNLKGEIASSWLR